MVFAALRSRKQKTPLILCSHVAALVFKPESQNQKGLDLINAATSTAGLYIKKAPRYTRGF